MTTEPNAIDASAIVPPVPDVVTPEPTDVPMPDASLVDATTADTQAVDTQAVDTLPVEAATADTTAVDVQVEAPPRRGSVRRRFIVAFLVGLVGATALGAGAMYAYDRQYTGRILPGVHVGTVDLSGLSADEAAARLTSAYANLGQGTVVIHGPDGDINLDYAALGRGPDVAGMVAEAMAVGRGGDLAQRIVGDVHAATKGVTLRPRVLVDAASIESQLGALAAKLDQAPLEASVSVDAGAFTLVNGANGRTADVTDAATSIAAQLGELDAPSTISVPLAVTTVVPHVTTLEADDARQTAERLAADVDVTIGADTFTLPGAKIRPLISFLPTSIGGYQPVVDVDRLQALVGTIAKQVDRKPVNATYLTSGNKVIGVLASKDGRALDVAATTSAVLGILGARTDGSSSARTAVGVYSSVQPSLTTDKATASKPLMRKISEWTTYFPITSHNGFGANIWIPALAIDGTVVAPHATFDFWKAIGPVTTAKGYRQGGAIINGHTEPQGALAGGICSCSTTLFNAALRAGFQMGARLNHYYYIDRYPLGLDATVFISSGGSVQTMSWTNDTDYPVLIRGYKIRKGDSGYVKFELYSVPTGRRVVIGDPVVRNVRPATDTIEYTSSLAPGVRDRIEYPVDGKQVWRTVTVYNPDGSLLRRITYYSNYSRVTGVTLVGRAAAAS